MDLRNHRRRGLNGVLLVGTVVLATMGPLAVPSQAEQVGDGFVATTGDDASDCASP
jgi:hypothetical protein